MIRSVKICQQIIEYLVKHGFTKQVHKNEVKQAIIYIRGPDPRTVKNWMTALETLGYLDKSSPFVFDMNLTKCPQLLTETLRGESQKKLL